VASSQLEEDFATLGLPSLFQQGGRSVTYDPAVGADVALTAIVHPEEASEDIVETGRQKNRRRRIDITTDPASDFGGVASPQLNDKVTIDSESWSVESFGRIAGEFIRMMLVRPQAIELARESLRRRP
jgi:hypothetical protein